MQAHQRAKQLHLCFGLFFLAWATAWVTAEASHRAPAPRCPRRPPAADPPQAHAAFTAPHPPPNPPIPQARLVVDRNHRRGAGRHPASHATAADPPHTPFPPPPPPDADPEALVEWIDRAPRGDFPKRHPPESYPPHSTSLARALAPLLRDEGGGGDSSDAARAGRASLEACVRDSDAPLAERAACQGWLATLRRWGWGGSEPGDPHGAAALEAAAAAAGDGWSRAARGVGLARTAPPADVDDGGGGLPSPIPPGAVVRAAGASTFLSRPPDPAPRDRAAARPAPREGQPPATSPGGPPPTACRAAALLHPAAAAAAAAADRAWGFDPAATAPPPPPLGAAGGRGPAPDPQTAAASGALGRRAARAVAGWLAREAAGGDGGAAALLGWAEAAGDDGIGAPAIPVGEGVNGPGGGAPGGGGGAGVGVGSRDAVAGRWLRRAAARGDPAAAAAAGRLTLAAAGGAADARTIDPSIATEAARLLRAALAADPAAEPGSAAAGPLGLLLRSGVVAPTDDNRADKRAAAETVWAAGAARGDPESAWRLARAAAGRGDKAAAAALAASAAQRGHPGALLALALEEVPSDDVDAAATATSADDEDPDDPAWWARRGSAGPPGDGDPARRCAAAAALLRAAAGWGGAGPAGGGAWRAGRRLLGPAGAGWGGGRPAAGLLLLVRAAEGGSAGAAADAAWAFRNPRAIGGGREAGIAALGGSEDRADAAAAALTAMAAEGGDAPAALALAASLRSGGGHRGADRAASLWRQVWEGESSYLSSAANPLPAEPPPPATLRAALVRAGTALRDAARAAATPRGSGGASGWAWADAAAGETRATDRRAAAEAAASLALSVVADGARWGQLSGELLHPSAQRTRTMRPSLDDAAVWVRRAKEAGKGAAGAWLPAAVASCLVGLARRAERVLRTGGEVGGGDAKWVRVVGPAVGTWLANVLARLAAVLAASLLGEPVGVALGLLFRGGGSLPGGTC